MADLRNRPSGGREQYKSEPEYVTVPQVVGVDAAAEAAAASEIGAHELEADPHPGYLTAAEGAAAFAASSHGHIAADISDFSTAADARITAASLAPSSKGVTNGDSHDHSGGDGAQIAYGNLSGVPTIYNQTVETSGTPVTQRGTVNFTGAGVSVADTGGKTQVSIPGGAGEAFPVGAVFISVVSTNPATLLGYGTWSAIAAGRVLVGLDAGDTDFDVVEETGGAKTVASAGSNSAPTFTGSALATHQHAAVSAGTPAGTNAAEAAHTHTYTQVPNHVHVQSVNSATTGGLNGYGVDTSTNTSTASGYSTANPTGGVATGTTAAGASHNHAFTGSALATHQHDAISAGTPAGSVSAPTFTGSATSVVQPYFVVYMWKRTA